MSLKLLHSPWPVLSGEGVRVAPESSESASARDEPPLENVLMGWVRGEREGSQTRVESGLKGRGKKREVRVAPLSSGSLCTCKGNMWESSCPYN